jgi:transcriptional regulator GlxA family with amidase domain
MKSVQIGSKAKRKPLVTAVIGTPEAGASGIFTILDVLSSVGRDWQVLHGEAAGDPFFVPRLVTLDGKPFSGPNGLVIEPHGSFADHPEPDIVIIPELNLDPSAHLPENFRPIADWLQAMHAKGALIASVCSGSLLLGQTGLLDGEEATSHWGYCDAMTRNFPKIRMRKERILVPAGIGHRLITAGGATSWYDLLLYLIGRFAGSEEARRVAKVFLLQSHGQGQLPFAGLTARRQHSDEMIKAAQLWIADNYKAANPVAAMASACGLTERSFHTRFKRATGMSPMDYAQTIRIEEAKQLLETSEMPLDEIAAEVGYAEPASFRRLFGRLVGVSPSAYRRQHLPAIPSIRMAN